MPYYLSPVHPLVSFINRGRARRDGKLATEEEVAELIKSQGRRRSRGSVLRTKRPVYDRPRLAWADAAAVTHRMPANHWLSARRAGSQKRRKFFPQDSALLSMLRASPACTVPYTDQRALSCTSVPETTNILTVFHADFVPKRGKT